MQELAAWHYELLLSFNAAKNGVLTKKDYYAFYNARISMEAVKLGYPPFPHCADLGLIGRHFDTMNSNDISYDGVKVEDIIEVGNNIWKYS